MGEDVELYLLKRKRLAELHRKLAAREAGERARPKELDVNKSLSKIFVGRAWEVFEAASRQYPEIMERLGRELAKHIEAGRIKEQITGEQLLWFLQMLGLDVRLDIKIRVLESGELKSLAEKLRGK